jgi:hypothetical protein
MTMILYRHWLEMRLRVLMSLLFTVLIMIAFASSITGSTRNYPANPALLEVLGDEAYRVWRGHAVSALVMALTMSLMSASSGIVSYPMSHGGLGGFGVQAHRSTYLTLSLPVSRRRLFVTRFAAGLVHLCLGFALSLALNCAYLAWTGLPVPLGPMAMASAAGLLMSVLGSGFICLLVLWVGLGWGTAIGITAAMIAMNRSGIVASNFTPGVVPWEAGLAAIATAAVFWWMALEQVRKREF